jgi:hypothetical protein
MPRDGYKAWIAVTTGSDAPATRDTQSAIPYETSTASSLPTTGPALSGGTLTNGIGRNQLNAVVAGSSKVWTNVTTAARGHIRPAVRGAHLLLRAALLLSGDVYQVLLGASLRFVRRS